MEKLHRYTPNNTDNTDNSSSVNNLYYFDDNAVVLGKDKSRKELMSLIDYWTLSLGVADVIGVELGKNNSGVSFRRVDGRYVIRLGLKVFLLSKYRFLLRLLHELAHVANDMAGVQDTCSNRIYHTKAFGRKMSDFGVACFRKTSCGYSAAMEFTQEAMDGRYKALSYSLYETILPPDSNLYKAGPYSVCPNCGYAL